MVIIKVSYNSDIRRFETASLSSADIFSFCRKAFAGLENKEFVLRYADDEGDWCTLAASSTGEELVQALRFASRATEPPVLRLVVGEVSPAATAGGVEAPSPIGSLADALENIAAAVVADLSDGIAQGVSSEAAAQGPAAPAQEGASARHAAWCDACGLVIEGVRFKCTQCPDFDLCATCEANDAAGHDENHVFAKIKFPVPRSLGRWPLLPNLYAEDDSTPCASGQGRHFGHPFFGHFFRGLRHFHHPRSEGETGDKAEEGAGAESGEGKEGKEGKEGEHCGRHGGHRRGCGARRGHGWGHGGWGHWAAHHHGGQAQPQQPGHSHPHPHAHPHGHHGLCGAWRAHRAAAAAAAAAQTQETASTAAERVPEEAVPNSGPAVETAPPSYASAPAYAPASAEAVPSAASAPATAAPGAPPKGVPPFTPLPVLGALPAWLSSVVNQAGSAIGNAASEVPGGAAVAGIPTGVANFIDQIMRAAAVPAADSAVPGASGEANQAAVDAIVAMGFPDDARTRQLLVRFDNSVERTVTALLNE